MFGDDDDDDEHRDDDYDDGLRIVRSESVLETFWKDRRHRTQQ